MDDAEDTGLVSMPTPTAYPTTGTGYSTGRFKIVTAPHTPTIPERLLHELRVEHIKSLIKEAKEQGVSRERLLQSYEIRECVDRDEDTREYVVYHTLVSCMYISAWARTTRVPLGGK